MNNEDFLKRLSEVAEWEYPKIAKTDAEYYNRPKRGRKSQEEQDWESAEEEAVDQPLKTNNDTAAPVILKYKEQEHACEDCGKIIGNRCIQYRKCLSSKPHWREICVNCGLYRDPRTGEFELRAQHAQAVFTAFHRGQGIYKSKYQVIKLEQNK